jgi:hypothetical protein
MPAVLYFIDLGKSSAFFVHLAKGRFKLAHSAAVIIEFHQGAHQSAPLLLLHEKQPRAICQGPNFETDFVRSVM